MGNEHYIIVEIRYVNYDNMSRDKNGRNKKMINIIICICAGICAAITYRIGYNDGLKEAEKNRVATDKNVGCNSDQI